MRVSTNRPQTRSFVVSWLRKFRQHICERVSFANDGRRYSAFEIAQIRVNRIIRQIKIDVRQLREFSRRESIRVETQRVRAYTCIYIYTGRPNISYINRTSVLIFVRFVVLIKLVESIIRSERHVHIWLWLSLQNSRIDPNYSSAQVGLSKKTNRSLRESRVYAQMSCQDMSEDLIESRMCHEVETS